MKRKLYLGVSDTWLAVNIEFQLANQKFKFNLIIFCNQLSMI